MFLRLLVVAVLLVGCAHPKTPKSTADSRAPQLAAPLATTPSVSFALDVRPILEARCQPCHFAGGRMYEKLPFDREETIHRLGSRLFTRIKADDEQQIIRVFLAQGHDANAGP
jgi:hypothetical protein